MTSSSHYIDIVLDDLEPVTLHYRTHGNPEHPVVYCMHALTCNAHDFDVLADELSQEFYVVAPDMPGRGKSAHLENKSLYTNDNHLRWALALLHELNIHSVHWVGASMGGIIGMMACTVDPLLVRSLMLNDVGSVLAKEGLQDIATYTGKPLPIGDNAALEAQLRDNFSPFGFTSETQWKHFFNSRVEAQADGTLIPRNDNAIVAPLRDMLRAMDEIEDIDLTFFWERVTCPTLLFHGEESLLLRKDTANSMAASRDNVILHHFPDIGHMPNLMDEKQVRIIHNWLNEQV